MTIWKTAIFVCSAALIAGFAAAQFAGTQYTGEAPAPEGPLTLWYRQPAADHPFVQPAGAPAIAAATAEWVKALPIGNGRLGAMVFGGVVNERLQLNEDTLWAGGPYDPVNPDAHDALPEIRRLLFDGSYADGAKLITDKFLARPVRQMPHETIGNLQLTFPSTNAAENYRRDLNLDTAIAHVEYTSAAKSSPAPSIRSSPCGSPPASPAKSPSKRR
jgi:alpha-L-fucosidase 2